jgi:hypothetical protein
MVLRFFFLFAVVLGLAPAADFVNEIHPILASRCLSCHSGAKPQAGLDLSSKEGASKVLDVLIARVEGRAGRVMPPVGKPLEAKQIELLKTWVAEGAPWVDVQKNKIPDWVAPLAPRIVNVPAGAGNPIDRFLGKPAKGVAGDSTFARRAFLDLWGIAPSPQDLDRFESEKNPAKRAQLVDRLLADDRRYTGHWISWWNDLLRNDIGVVYHGDRKSITPWLERALRTNMPYDEMVRELLNPIGNESAEGFLIGVNWRGEVNASQTPYMQASQNTAQIFLGINLKCASCHDSFINKYKLKEAYGLAAMFSQESKLELVRCDNKTGVYQEPEFLWPELGKIPAGASTSERRLYASRLFTHPQNGRLARTIVNRFWQRLMGKGLVEPVDDMDAKPSNPDLLDWLAADFSAHGYDLKHLLKLLMSSEAYQRLDAAPRRISAEQFSDTLSAITGEWRFLQTNNSDRALLGRDWQFKSNPLGRALGRPIRDQVYTTRNEDATTFQALELANGSTLAKMIHRGVMRLMDELPPAPASLFDSLAMRSGEKTVEIPVKGLKQIYLLTEDAGTYDPDKAEVGWAEVTLSGPAGTKVLESGRLRTKIGSRRVYEVDSGYEKLTAKVWISDASKASDINTSVRFFVFGAEPDPTRLVKVAGENPWPAAPKLTSVDQAVDYLWRGLLSRRPTDEERLTARKLFPGGKLQREGTEDLLWSLLMHPEFQFTW